MLFVKKGKDYKQIFRQSKRIRGEYFTILVQKKEQFKGPAFGIIVSKKVGNAVVRNKLKRRIRAFLRQKSGELPSSFYGAIIAQPGAGQIGWDTIVNDLTNSLSKFRA